MNYPAGAVVESGNPNLVDTIFVDGELVKRDGRLLNHDFAKIRQAAEEARDRVLSRAGVTDPGLWQPPVYAAPSN
jgi:5-methylthioadenosine/S-adenosylhomocysteine deaminase